MGTQRAGQLIEAGMWLQMSGDVDGARRLFEQALALDPTNARAKELLRPALKELDWAQALAPAADEAAAPPGLAQPPAIAPIDVDWAAELAGLPDPRTIAAPNDPGPIPELPEFVDPVDIPVQLPAPETASVAPVVKPVQFASNATSAWDSHSNPGVHINGMKPGVGDAMDLVAPPPGGSGQADATREEVRTLLQGARDLLELDDHTGAIDLILKAKQLAPNDPEVEALRERSEKTLQSMFESKLGSMSARPRVQLKDDEIIWLNLDHRAGFVLAQIDGTVTFEDLFEVCGMSRLDTARILAQLVEEGVIVVR